MSQIADYLAHGWKLCAIPPGQKGPNTRGWQQPDAVFSARTGWGVGLCHAYSGTCALDVDDYDRTVDWFAEHGLDLEALIADPFSVRIHSGRANRAKLLFKLSSPLPSLKLAPYVVNDPETGKQKTYHAFELRCASRDGLTVQDVLPPSIHPTTQRAYEWQYGDDLIADWKSLPELPSELFSLWTAEVGQSTRLTTDPAATGAPAAIESTSKGAHTDEIAALLTKFDPDSTYDDWLKIGAALHFETKGARDGLLLWNEWSAKGSKYEGLGDLETHYRTFKLDGPNPVTLGSLLRETVAGLDEFGIVPPGTEVGEDMRPSAVVQRLLETRLVHVTGQDKYYDLKTGNWLSDRGVRHAFCPYMPNVIRAGKNGKPDKVERPDPVKYLMESETKQTVEALAIHPGEGEFFTQDGIRYVNRFKAEKIDPLRPKAYEQEAFQFLWSRIKDRDFALWLMKFYAHAVQRPGIKITSAPILFSEAQGSGKSTIARTIPERLFGSRWVNSMSGDVLGGTFNDMLADTWWVYMDELRSGVSKGERVRATNKMKAWITDPFIEVHKKGMAAFNMPNRLQLTASSNFEDALQIDNNDRRWGVGELGGPLSERESIDLYHFLNSDRAPGVLRYIFGAVSLLGFSPTGRAPQSRAKRTMIRAGIGSWESLLVERMVAGESPFDRDMFTQQMVRESVIFRGSPPTAVGLGRILAKPPFSCEALKGQGETRYLCWRNTKQWLRYGAETRATYVATGIRPKGGNWSDAVPDNIRDMSADGDLDPVDCSELESLPESIVEFF